MKNRFIHNFKHDTCIIVDKENDIICTFKKGKFNDTQEYSVTDEQLQGLSVSQMAKIMREFGDYLAQNHRDIVE